LRRVAAFGTAHGALEDIVGDLDPHALAIHRMGRIGREQEIAVGPQVIVPGGPARPVERGLEERDEVHVTIAVVVVLRPVELGVHSAQRLG